MERRGWRADFLGLWVRCEQNTTLRVKLTMEGEDKLFGDSSDDSELQLAEVLQFASHFSCEQWSTSTMDFASMFEIANDPVPSLEYLSWTSVPRGTSKKDPVLHAINSKKLSKLTYLAISSLRLKELEVLARAIESGCLQLLVVLCLDGAEGHLALAEVMRAGHLPSLETLTLFGNHSPMSSIECQAYATAFSSGKLPSLTTIRFRGHSSIGNEGAKALAHAIQSGELKNLADLDLDDCAIGDDGIIAIAGSFRAELGNSVVNLKSLTFASNPITDVGLLSLADVLRTGHLNSLQDLHIGTCYSRTVASALVSAIDFNLHLNVQVHFHWLMFPDLQRRKDQLLLRNSRYRDILAGLVGLPVVPATFGKIYLCGDPEVGKTTLRRSLQRSLWKSLWTWERRPHVEKRTRGIDISKFSTKEKDRTLLIWDMAGQRDYHLIHNAFFPDLGSIEGKATIFLVVCRYKSTLAETEQQLAYWLRFIASSCGKATQNRRHVTVVLNRNKGNPKAKRLAPMWKQALECLRGKFRDYLDIQTHPFIVDARRRGSVNDLKRYLFEHSRNLLQGEKVPEVCQTLQENVIVWSKACRQFPVVHWTDFVTQVRERSNEPWGDEDLQAATRYLNEAGLLIYIHKEVFSRRKLVVMDPSWVCRDVVGNMFLHQEMVGPAERPFRMEVDKSTGSISLTKFKEFFKIFSKEWTPTHIEDLITILLWLGLCYQGRDENIFIPSLIGEIGTPGHNWGHQNAHDNRFDYGEDQWVMGFSVEHHEKELTLAPITLWHRFQVELAQTVKFNGHPDNDFLCGRYFMTFSADDMAVLVEVTTNQGSPSFGHINIFVKPLHAINGFDGNHMKQSQVDLASDLVEILLKLWNEVCPGVEYLHRVIWPWPAGRPGLHVMPKRNVDVEKVKKWVQEHNCGRKMHWRVGSSSTITEDQLLSSKDKDGLGNSVTRTLHIVRQVMEEAVDLGIYPRDVLTSRESSITSDEGDASRLPRSTTGRWVMEKLEKMDKQLNEVDQKVDNLGELSREILKNQKRLRQMLLDTGDIFLQDKERSCPRFLYLGKKSSGAWVTFKEALSPSVSARLHFACEARYDDYGQHAVTDQHGLEVSQFKKWAAAIAPWLKVSLTALYISAKIAANVVTPGLGIILPNFEDWQQASSLSEGLALATGFSREILNNHLIEGMGLDTNDANWDPRELYGKSRAAMSELLGKMTAKDFEEKLGLRKVCLYYADGSLHGIVWICNACFEEYGRSKLSMTELY